MSETLRDAVHGAVMSRLQPMRRVDLPAACDSIGLPEAPDEGTKAEYVRSRLALVTDPRPIAERFLAEHGDSMPSRERYALEEILWSGDQSLQIPKKQRHLLARALGDARDDLGIPLFLQGERFLLLVDRLWIRADLLDIFAGESRLRAEIRQHVVLNEADWPVEYLFEQLGAFDSSDRRLILFVEGLVSADLRPDEPSQRAFVGALNPVLAEAGLELREVGTDGGYPVFRVVATRSPAGRPKTLIFASRKKPDLRISDVVSNEIEILSAEDEVLVYERPIGNEGLRWKDLQEWWSDTRKIPEPTKAKSTLYARMLRSLPGDSPPQQQLFKGYHYGFGAAIPEMPALLPEVWLHWDWRTVAERGAAALLNFRMDFLLLLPHGVRVVIEVDGAHHYTRDGRGDPAKYAAMARGDRELRLAGYEVYRFGADELLGPGATERVVDFFRRLFAWHSLPVPSADTSAGRVE